MMSCPIQHAVTFVIENKSLEKYNFLPTNVIKSNSVAMMSKAEVCGLSIAGIVNWNPTEDMGSSLAIVLCCVGSNL
jgi:hypothetical protein